MITLEQIKKMYEEKIEMERNNRGRIVMMLNKEEPDAWNDFFVNQTDYKIYHDENIVEIPVNEIEYQAIKEKGAILKRIEFAEAIKNWCDSEIEN